jgi:hypothetical protein
MLIIHCIARGCQTRDSNRKLRLNPRNFDKYLVKESFKCLGVNEHSCQHFDSRGVRLK